MAIQEEFGSFSHYLWSFVDHTPIQNECRTLADVPSETDLSRLISKDLKKRGCSFVGPTIMYAYMQSIGMVNDHLIACHRYEDLSQ
jgi:DNA-3-methyladenine glycosylase I